MKKFEDLHFLIRYLIYIGISVAILFIINPYNDRFPSGILIASFVSTALSIMDMAWNKTGEGDSKGKEDASFMIGQLVRLYFGFFVFIFTYLILQLISGLIK